MLNSNVSAKTLLQTVLSEIRRKERVCLFIDNSDLFGAVQSSQTTYGKRVDYIKLRDVLSEGRSVNSSRFYYSEPAYPRDATSDEAQEAAAAAKKRQSFYYVLQRAGYTTVSLPQRDYDDDLGLEIEIVYDMCAASMDGKFDTIILVAGNEDYARTISRLRQDTGISVDVAFFANSCSYRLRQAANRFIDLTEERISEEIFRNLDREERSE